MATDARLLRFGRHGGASQQTSDWTPLDTAPYGSARSQLDVLEQLLNGHRAQGRGAGRLRRFGAGLASAKVVLTTLLLTTGVAIAPGHSPFPAAVHALTFAGFGLAGAWLLIGARRDRRASALGTFFLIVATAFGREAGRSWSMESASVTWLPLRVLARQNLDPLLPVFLWLFAREFPKRPMTAAVTRVVRVTIACSATLGLVLCVTDALRFAPRVVAIPTSWLVLGRSNEFWLLTAALTVAALIFMVARCQDARGAERVRSRWFVLSLTIGLLPLFLEVLGEALVPSFEHWVQMTRVRPFVGSLLVCCLLTIPATTTYAVLARRVLEVRVVLRRALQCALAKYSFMVVSIAPLARVGWLLGTHPQLGLAGLTATPLNRVTFGGAVVGVVLLAMTDRVLRRMDHLFFGPPYDVRAVVADVTARVSRAADAGAVGEIIQQAVTTVLDPWAMSVMLRNPVDAEGAFSDRSSRLAEDSPLVDCLARSPESAVPVTDRLLRAASLDDAAWVARHGIECIVPLRGTDGEVLGFIGVAERRNEQPYQPEDRTLLVALAASAAIALERQGVRSAPVIRPGSASWEAAAECPECGLVSPAGERSLCGTCGVPLERCHIPCVVSGKFLVRRRLGRGGMGVVYLAEDLNLRRYVALKTLSYLSVAASRRSRAEALAMASVTTHPNLATIYGCEHWENRPILVMEYLEGGTLAARLTAQPPTIVDVVDWGLGLSEGLRGLHRRGRLHGDIKPSNIAFDAEGVPKLLDFGLTQMLDATDAAGAQWGTPAYQCPEAIGGQIASPRFDLWSLAAVLYEAVAGHAAFLRLRATGSCPLEWRGRRAEVPPELKLFFARALSARFEDRPASADEFSLWLRRGRPIA